MNNSRELTFFEIMGRYFSNINSKLDAFSRWCLGGSLAGIFTILISIKDLSETYTLYQIRFFLVFQILSICMGIYNLYRSEIKNASKNILNKDPIEDLIIYLKDPNNGSNGNFKITTDDINNLIEKREGENMALAIISFFKVVTQVIFLLVGLSPMIYQIFVMEK